MRHHYLKSINTYLWFLLLQWLLWFMLKKFNSWNICTSQHCITPGWTRFLYYRQSFEPTNESMMVVRCGEQEKKNISDPFIQNWRCVLCIWENVSVINFNVAFFKCLMFTGHYRRLWKAYNPEILLNMKGRSNSCTNTKKPQSCPVKVLVCPAAMAYLGVPTSRPSFIGCNHINYRANHYAIYSSLYTYI